MLALVCTVEQGSGHLGVEKSNITPLSWTDHLLVRFRLAAASYHHRGGGVHYMGCPRRRMDPESFLRSFLAALFGVSSEALIDFRIS